MAWLKAGDTAAMNERVLNIAALPGADERSVNETFGFVMRLFLQAAQQETDYTVSLGTAMVLSPRYELLLEQAAGTGLLRVEVADGQRVVKLVQDEEFMHMRSREELEWERRRKADTSNTDLTVPVRVRDGDACRYCGQVVSFGMRRGGRAGTYDHLRPGRAARSVDDLVVACGSCNAGRREAEGGRGQQYELLPPPSEDQRYFSKRTIQWFEEQARVFHQLGLEMPRRPKGARDLKVGSQSRSDVPAPSGAPAREDGGTGNAAPAIGGDQRPEAARTALDAPSVDVRPRLGQGHAATAPSGDQRPGHRPSATPSADATPAGDLRAEHARPGQEDLGAHRRGGTGSATAPATSATSEGTRAEVLEPVPAASESAREVRPEPASTPGLTCTNTRSGSFPETEPPGSGFPGTGRDGTGRAGQARLGPEARAPQGAGTDPGGARRSRRGRRRRGRKS